MQTDIVRQCAACCTEGIIFLEEIGTGVIVYMFTYVCFGTVSHDALRNHLVFPEQARLVASVAGQLHEASNNEAVIPAKAGIHRESVLSTGLWIPAFAGTTSLRKLHAIALASVAMEYFSIPASVKIASNFIAPEQAEDFRCSAAITDVGWDL